MCGISGIWKFNQQKVSASTIERFNNTLVHRGPDGFGTFIDDESCLALGHRRLSILDLSEAGKQPMASASKRYILTFNGEIYNFIELRDELKKSGFVFKTDTDTEVILAAWEQWKHACWHRFNGMWAIAIWDTEERKLILCRDRFGVKPLYFLNIPSQIFAFASETVAFKQLEGFERTMASENVSLCLKDPHYLEAVGETIFTGIKKLLPGHYMTVSSSQKVTTEQWWITEQNKVDVPETYAEQVEMFRELLTDACRIRLRSDVSIATALSGGLDSSSVYCTINQIKKSASQIKRVPKDWQRAVVASFPGTTMDEKSYANDVIEYTNGTGLFVYPDPNSVQDGILQEVKHEDFIYSYPPVVHNIYKMMKQNGITVSLDGHGVDEMIYGYPFDVLQAFTNLKDHTKKREMLHAYAGLVDKPLGEVEDTYFPNSKLKYFVSRAINKVKPKAKPAKSWIMQEAGVPADYYENDRTESADKLFRIPYRLFHVNSLPTLLRNWDSASMRHGVEIRMPFMDWRLVTYVFSLPFEAKVGSGYSKKILRDAMKGMMPENVRLRRHKIGINAPVKEWFAGALNSFILDAVHSKDFLESGIWNGAEIRDFVLERNKRQQWIEHDCTKIWPYLNAWLIDQK